MTKERPNPIGVGMPALLKLHVFGRIIQQAFGAEPYLVGSALKVKTPRDVDVRLVLDGDTWDKEIGPLEYYGLAQTRWAALCLAFSALGAEMTGRPIDFQLMPVERAREYDAEPRLLLGWRKM